MRWSRIQSQMGNKQQVGKSADAGKPHKQEMHCKIQNPQCGLEMGESLALGAVGVMSCDVCCSEPHFCRECLCILCGETMECGAGAFSSVRCFARLSGDGFCGHGAHLTCAVNNRMAGVLKQHNLDMEYICRRCDQRTDLREHIVRLLDSFRYANSITSAQTSLHTVATIVKGTEADGGRKLLQLVETAIEMMGKDSGIGEVFDLLHGTDPEVIPGTSMELKRKSSLPTTIDLIEENDNVSKRGACNHLTEAKIMPWF